MRGALALLVGFESSPVAHAGSEPNRTFLGRSSANHPQWSADKKRRVQLIIDYLAVGASYSTFCDDPQNVACCFSSRR
jgi:hypothetical protein